MLLLALRRPGATVLVVSPLLLVASAVPGAALLGSPWLIAAALRGGQGVLWAFVAMYVFFLGVGAYAFGKAAWAQQVHCQREGSRVRARTRTEAVDADAASVQLLVARRRVGGGRPVTLHEVTLSAPGWPRPILLQSGLTPWFARAAERRLREHLGLTR